MKEQALQANREPALIIPLKTQISEYLNLLRKFKKPVEQKNEAFFKENFAILDELQNHPFSIQLHSLIDKTRESITEQSRSNETTPVMNTISYSPTPVIQNSPLFTPPPVMQPFSFPITTSASNKDNEEIASDYPFNHYWKPPSP